MSAGLRDYWTRLDEWSRELRKSTKGRRALDELGKLKSINPQRFPLLQSVVLDACYRARHYPHDETEPFQAARKQSRKLQKELPGTIGALNAARDFSKRHPVSARLAFDAALAETIGKRRLTVDGRAGLPAIDPVDFFERLANRLRANSPRPDISFVGPIMYRRTVADQKHFPDLRLVGLALILTSRFRDWTHGGEITSQSNGRRMPKHGRPCYSQVAALVSVALDKKIEGRQIQEIVRKMLRRNPGLGIGHFPKVDN